VQLVRARELSRGLLPFPHLDFRFSTTDRPKLEAPPNRPDRNCFNEWPSSVKSEKRRHVLKAISTAASGLYIHKLI
jgi:hypothetical protein